MTFKALKTLLLSLLCISVLSACGFQLRGSDKQYTIEYFAIVGDNRFDGVASEVQRLAESHRISIIDNKAPWRLRISDEKIEQWLASSTQSYSRNEYWLSISVEVIYSHNETEFLPIKLKRETIFQDNTDKLNSKSGEKEHIIRELRIQLAEEILYQLSFLAANPPDCNCDEN